MKKPSIKAKAVVTPKAIAKPAPAKPSNKTPGQNLTSTMGTPKPAPALKAAKVPAPKLTSPYGKPV